MKRNRDSAAFAVVPELIGLPPGDEPDHADEGGIPLHPDAVQAMRSWIGDGREQGPGLLPIAIPDPAQRRKELAEWWHAQADSDLEMLLPKAIEYSAHDLRMTGHVLADMMGIAPVSDAFAAELACATYLFSKITRMLGAYKEGRLPGIDSATDARVYSTMIARIREQGGWPGWTA